VKKNYCILFFVFLLLQNSFAQSPRSTLDFNSGWKFYLGNDSTAFTPNHNDSAWRKLSLPHDWSIESNFIKDAPATNQGGSLPGGIGWYRKTFMLPASSKNKNVSIEFDGVYRNSEVWINGHYLGKRPNGYTFFQYDLTPDLKYGAEKNVIAVRVDNSQQPDSRWYTGSGIYRNVRLVTKNKIAFDYAGPFISTSLFSFESGHWELYNKNNKGDVFGDVHINAVPISNNTMQSQKVIVINTVYDDSGKKLAEHKTGTINIDAASGQSISIERTDGVWGVKNPILWSVDHPYLYKLVTAIYWGDVKQDEISTNIGFRKFEFDSAKGFFLNGESLKIKGVCMHHDLGALGAAFNYRAAERQLQILKDMGCNAIRTAHNPPAPGFLDLCDKMGFLVMDEAFDMWRKRKNKNKYDYHLDFDEWHERDLQAMVLRDRNHPSVFMWSIGNEIREQFDSSGTAITKQLVDIVKRLDPIRPVTSALTETMPEKNFITKANALDVLGFNYKYYDYAALPQRFPGQKFLATETASALSTRGVYQFPSDSMRIWPPDYKAQDTFIGNKDYTASAYDNTYAYWGGTHEKTWLAVKKYPHMAGIFVWSGFDFLGEPLPYPKYPARSSYYGIIDLAGFPKDVYYMYQSEWTTKPVLHIFPHWNWNKGDIVDIWAYYNNADEVELYLNGRSVGKRSKTDSTLHVMWRVPFETGTLKAISRKNGKTVLVRAIKTAGKPARIELTADRKLIRADGRDLSFITVRIVDKNGNPVPDADNLVEFSILGNAIIAATDNGYQADTLSLTSHKRRVWKGMALAIVKASSKKGNSTLTASSPGLPPATIALKIAD
jgi:beta-galactosidase